MTHLRRSGSILVSLVLLALVPLGCAEEVVSEVAPATEEEKTLYALGMAVAQNLATFELSEEELAFVQAGVADVVLGQEAKVELAEYVPKLEQLARSRMVAAGEREKAAGAEFAVAEAAEPGAETSASGMIYFEVAAGEGESPSATDVVTAHYTGTLADGTVFDSSVERGQPATFPLNQVIACWSEGVQKMRVGGKARLVCPPEIAYGEQGAPPRIPPGATLVFEVELLGIEGTPSSPEGS